MINVLRIVSGAFYTLLCVFSIVTGLMYSSGKRKMNPLELSDKFMSKYDTPEKLKRFTIRMGWVTFAVGIVQGITAFALIKAGKPIILLDSTGIHPFFDCFRCL